MNPSLKFLGCCWLLAHVAFGDPALPQEPPSPNVVSPVFMVRTASGKRLSGVVTRLEADFNAVLDVGPVAAGELVSMQRQGALLPPLPGEPHVVFANGDRLTGEVLSIESDRVKFRAWLSRDGGALSMPEVTIPLPALSLIWFRAPPVESRDGQTPPWAGERRRRDLVLMRNGDIRRGTVQKLDEPIGTLTLVDEGKEIRLDAGQVVAVALNTDLSRSLRPRGVYGRMTLSNGARLSFVEPSIHGLSLQVKTLFGATVQVRLEEVAQLETRQGRAIFLSDLKPVAYEHQPYLGVRWPYQLDRSVTGKSLRLGGHVYDKGIGMHSQSRLSFDLNGQYRRFESWVGLDDLSGQGGRVVVRVLADDQPIAGDNEELSTTTGPRFIEADVTGRKRLTLVVEFGAAGDVCDHVNWCEARLIR